MSRQLALVLMFLLVTSGLLVHELHGQIETGTPASDIPFDPSIRAGTLDNGMRYFIQYNAKPENRAELRLAVAAGSMQEDDDQLGVAHFVEHMAFNGSTNFSKNELVDYLESVGTRFGPDLNAYTSFDETVYMLQVRTDDADHLTNGLLVLQDWAGGVAFDDDEIDKERGVVVSEWRTRLSAGQRMQQQYFPVMLHQSRYAERLPIGDPAIIENAAYDVIRRFYQDWYRPDLMCVIVVGDVDPDAIEADITARFSQLEAPAAPRFKEEYSVPGHDETLISICSDPEASFTNVRIMYKHPEHPTNDLQDYRQNLVHQLYNRMLNARLYELNSTADPPFVFASSGFGNSIGDMATYTSSAMVPEGGTLRAFQVLLTENKRVRDHGFVQSELDRMVEDMIQSMQRRAKEKDKMESRQLASRLVAHFLSDIPMPDPDQTLALYQQFLPEISLQEVNELAGKWMRDHSRVIIVTGPDNEENPLPTEGALLTTLSTVESQDVDAYIDDIVDAPLFDQTLPGSVITKRWSDPEVEIHGFTLANGVEVLYKQTDFKNDEILMAAYSPGGHSLYDNEIYKDARAVTSILRESGLGDLSPPQLDKQLSGQRVSVRPMISERYEGFNGSSSVEDFETLFQLVYLYATRPRFEEDGLQAYKKKQETIYNNLLTNPNNYFGNEVTRIRYNHHPRRGFPDASDLQALDLATIQEVYADRFADMSDFTFVFTGNLDPAKLEALCEQYLGSLPTSERQEQWKDIGVTYPAAPVDTTFYRGAAPKSNVRVIFHGTFDWNDRSRFVYQAMIAYLRIQLRETLREDLGGVYGVSLSGSSQKDPSPRYAISMSFNADPPRTQELLKAAYDVIERARSSEISQEDLNKVKETQRQSRVKSLQQNRYWHSGIISHLLNGDHLARLTMSYLESMLDDLDANDIQNAVRRYFDDSRRIEAILHPEAHDQQ